MTTAMIRDRMMMRKITEGTYPLQTKGETDRTGKRTSTTKMITALKTAERSVSRITKSAIPTATHATKDTNPTGETIADYGLIVL